MADDKKQRVVNFYGLVNKKIRSTEQEPSKDIWELIEEILKLNELDRVLDIKADKFMFLDSATINTTKTITAYFTSARNRYRADLFNRSTGRRRPNPKEDTEGEEQKTHIVIRIETGGVKVVLEQNHNGVGIENILWYLNTMNSQLFDGVDYRIGKTNVINSDFMQQIRRMRRVTLAELFVDKQILGDGTLGFSNRTAEIRHRIVLQVQPTRGQSIKNAAIDFYNTVNDGGTALERLRLKGKDDYNNDVTLDTLNFLKKDSAFFDVNNKGEVETMRAYTILKGFLTEFDVS